jgi:ubiquitin C-terminal hydrolase
VQAQAKQSGSFAPRHFVRVVQHANADFHSPLHQDAQELLSFLLNRLSETIKALDADAAERVSTSTSASASASPDATSDAAPCDAGDGARGDSAADGATAPAAAQGAGARTANASSRASTRRSKHDVSERPTLIEDVFVGRTVTNTMCMNCEKVGRKQEDFKELKVEMEKPDTTLERCMLATRRASAAALEHCKTELAALAVA